MEKSKNGERPNRLFRNLSAKIASIPMILTAVVVFLGGTLWTVLYSFTSSRLLPKLNFVGIDQYERLWNTRRWLISIENLALFGLFSMFFTLAVGFTLAKVNPTASVKNIENKPNNARFSIEINQRRVFHKRSY